MSKVRIELNLAGINELMKSAEIQAALQEAGEAVAQAAGGLSGGAKYAAQTHTADWVAITNVYPDDAEAARANYKDNVLLKGVGQAGLPTKKPRL